jgi:hypothetical protein
VRCGKYDQTWKRFVVDVAFVVNNLGQNPSPLQRIVCECSGTKKQASSNSQRPAAPS